jgi:hypothetical protein
VHFPEDYVRQTTCYEWASWLRKLRPPPLPDKAIPDLTREVAEISAHFSAEAQADRWKNKTKGAEDLTKGRKKQKSERKKRKKKRKKRKAKKQTKKKRERKKKKSKEKKRKGKEKEAKYKRAF